MSQVTTVITAKLEGRPDGGLRVSSPQLPGLNLAGSDADRVVAMVAPAIEAILKHLGVPVISVTSAEPIEAVLHNDRLADIDMHVRHYVVSLRDAA